MKRVFCVFCVIALAALGTASAGDTNSRPSSLYEAAGWMNAPTGPLAMFTDGAPHATNTPDTTLVHARETNLISDVFNVPPFPAFVNIFTEYFFPGPSMMNPPWEFNDIGEHFFPDNSALVEIHYSMQANSAPFIDGVDIPDGIYMQCDLCQDMDAVPGDFEACIPCSTTLLGPNLMADLNTNISVGGLVMPGYSGYGIVYPYFPTRFRIELTTFQGRTATATFNNLILRYPQYPPGQPIGAEPLPPTSDDNFRRSR